MDRRVDVAMVTGPVSIEDVRSDAAGCGADCVFIGRTRPERHELFGDLLALDYEAYGPMAVRVIEGVAADAADEFGCAFVGVAHSVGRVPVGAPSVIVRVLAPHRAEAFEACRVVIDRLKAEAPIWKREVWERGATWREDVALAAPEGSR